MRRLRSLIPGILLLLPQLAACGPETATTPSPTVVQGAADATVTVLPTVASGVATAVSTAVTGAATAISTNIPADLSQEETDYLNEVNGIATRLQNSTEIEAAATALAEAVARVATGSTVDAQALTDSLNQAAAFVDGIEREANALEPPERLQSIQDQLEKTVNSYDDAVQSSIVAVASANWTDAAVAVEAMTRAATELTTLDEDLAELGIR
jgi:hypothetical protein